MPPLVAPLSVENVAEPGINGHKNVLIKVSTSDLTPISTNIIRKRATVTMEANQTATRSPIVITQIDIRKVIQTMAIHIIRVDLDRAIIIRDQPVV